MIDKPYIKASLRMGVYGREGSDGKMEYVIANKGTNPSSIPDWVNDLQQYDGSAFGQSPDLTNSLAFAKEFVDQHPDAKITFVGHSKGGAEAAANAVKFNRNAILFNPAIPDFEAYKLDTSVYSGKMTSYVVKGEILNKIFGPMPIGDVVYLPTQYSVHTTLPAVNDLDMILNHLMGSVKQAITDYEEGIDLLE